MKNIKNKHINVCPEAVSTVPVGIYECLSSLRTFSDRSDLPLIGDFIGCLLLPCPSRLLSVRPAAGTPRHDGPSLTLTRTKLSGSAD